MGEWGAEGGGQSGGSRLEVANSVATMAADS